MDEALADPSPMPYLKETLRPKGLLLSGYKPALPGGLANLIALVSGQRPTAEQRGNCPAYDDVDLAARTGCVFAKDVETLPGQLTAVGKTWRAYVEDSDAGQPPDTCRHPAPGGALEPVMARNPYLFFHAIVDSPDCAANTAGTSRLVPDTEDAESAPTLSLVIPNACHDGADPPCADGTPAGPAAADVVAVQRLPFVHRDRHRPACAASAAEQRRGSGPDHPRTPDERACAGRVTITIASSWRRWPMSSSMTAVERGSRAEHGSSMSSTSGAWLERASSAPLLASKAYKETVWSS